MALVVPATGRDPSLKASLDSLLRLDYPDLQLIFVTRGPQDPAAAVIDEAIRSHPHARHITNSSATTCGQKNHNLLTGIDSLAGRPEVLAFCDSTRIAPSDWLRELVAPVARGETPIASGYHHVIPGDTGIATLGRTVNVLFLHLMRGITWLNQPWGGSTAITGALFDRLDVAALWAENVVDDVSLAALLKRAGIGVVSTPGAVLTTPLSGESWEQWQDWLVRQWLYLKFCLPASWLMAGLICHLLAALMIFSVVQLLAPLFGGEPNVNTWAAAGFLLLLAALGTATRPLHPRPSSLLRWIPAVYASFFMASWCHLRTTFTREIHWRGISYRVGWKGKVKAIREIPLNG